MGQAIVCECGQRNDLAVFGYGEEKLCLSCGKALRLPEAVLLEESFEAVVSTDAFEADDQHRINDGLNSFESPTPSEQTEGVASPTPDRSAPTRAWSEGIREVASEGVEGTCARCGRPFRGDWDRNPHADGDVCHLCAVRADDAYKVPTFTERNDLMRPKPPRPVARTEEKIPSKWEEHKQGILILSGVGICSVIAVTVLPVEYWMAALFAPDRERAQDLPVAWMWVVKVLGFVASAFGQGLGLYVTLALLELLYEDMRDNLPSIIFLGIAFAVMNAMVDWGTAHFGVFGLAAGILLGMAFIVSFIIKLLMISARFPLRMEGGCGFVLAWFLCSLLLGPAMRMVEQLLGALVAAIAL